jgi:hypothetical protein
MEKLAPSQQETRRNALKTAIKAVYNTPIAGSMATDASPHFYGPF